MKEESKPLLIDGLEKEQNSNEFLLKVTSSEKLYGFFWRALLDKNFGTAGKILRILEKKIQTSVNKKELKPMFFLAKANLENRLKNFSSSIKIIKETLELTQLVIMSFVVKIFYKYFMTIS